MILRLFVTSLLAISLFTGCANKVDVVDQANSSNGAPEGSLAAGNSDSLAELQVTFSSVEVAPGTSQELSATAVFPDDSHKSVTENVTWSSSDPNVVSISKDGVATSVNPGTAVITATLASGKSQSIKVHVSDAKLVSIQVDPVNPTLYPGMTNQFTATGIFSDNTHQDITNVVTWKSSNVAVASITAGGAKHHDDDDHDDEGIHEDDDEDEDADDAVSAIPGGLATVQGVGLTTITATFNHDQRDNKDNGHGKKSGEGHQKTKNISGSTTLTVKAARLVALNVNPSAASIPAGLSQQLTVTGKWSDGQIKDMSSIVTWTSSDTAVASVSNLAGSQGLVFAVAVGTATITVTDPDSGITGSANVTATPAQLVSMAITPGTASVAKGLTQNFVATGTYTDNSVKDITAAVTWNSSNSFAVMVSNAAGSAGLANAFDLGAATVTATDPATGKSATASMTVTPALLVALKVSPASAIIEMGQTANFTATGSYTDRSIQDLTSVVTWKTDNIAIAQASNAAGSNGLVTPVGVGVATLHAIDPASGIFATAGLSIKPAPVLVSMAVSPQNVTVVSGGTQQFSAAGTYDNGKVVDMTQMVTWNTSLPTYSSISNLAGSNGLFSISPNLLKPGYVITVSATDAATALIGTATVTVGSNQVCSSALTVTPDVATSIVGTNLRYTATCMDVNRRLVDVTNSVTWSSSNPLVADVNPLSKVPGVIQTLAVGTAAITAYDPNTCLQASGTLNVIPGTTVGLASLDLNGRAISATDALLDVTGYYTNGTNRIMTDGVKWYWDPMIVTMLRPGHFTAIAPGAGMIYAIDPTTGIRSNAGSITVSTDLTTGSLVISVIFERKLQPIAAEVAVRCVKTPLADKRLIERIAISRFTILKMSGGAISPTDASFKVTGVYTDGTTADVTTQVNWLGTGNVMQMVSPGVFTAVGPGSTRIYADDGTGLLSNPAIVDVKFDLFGNLVIAVAMQ